MHFRVRAQREEVLGDLNRFYCSLKRGEEVKNENELWMHFIKTGGAKDFARRFDESMSDLNRWYCSQFHNRDVREPKLLWDYYMNYHQSRTNQTTSSTDPSPNSNELAIAC